MTSSPRGRMHVTKAVITFVLAEDETETGPEFEATFDFDGNEERRIGSIFFGPMDLLRAQGFADPKRIRSFPVEEWLEAPDKFPNVAIRQVSQHAAARSAPRLCWHEEDTCYFYCPR